MEISQFVLDNCFERIDTPDGPVYYVPTIDNDGWVVCWTNGDYWHTWRNPADWVRG